MSSNAHRPTGKRTDDNSPSPRGTAARETGHANHRSAAPSWPHRVIGVGLFTIPWLALCAFIVLSRDQANSAHVYARAYMIVDERVEALTGSQARRARQHIQNCARTNTTRSAGVPEGLAWMFRDITPEERNNWVTWLLHECAMRYANDGPADIPAQERLEIVSILRLRDEAAGRADRRAHPPRAHPASS